MTQIIALVVVNIAMAKAVIVVVIAAGIAGVFVVGASLESIIALRVIGTIALIVIPLIVSLRVLLILTLPGLLKACILATPRVIRMVSRRYIERSAVVHSIKLPKRMTLLFTTSYS
jgi:hypothetical protein